MEHLRKILPTELRGNERFFNSQSGIEFQFQPLFGKMIAAPPESGKSGLEKTAPPGDLEFSARSN